MIRNFSLNFCIKLYSSSESLFNINLLMNDLLCKFAELAHFKEGKNTQP